VPTDDTLGGEAPALPDESRGACRRVGRESGQPDVIDLDARRP
jgi:hypothetical protein